MVCYRPIGLFRGVHVWAYAYVHCVTHRPKFIMVKLGGNEKHIKYVKKHLHFTNSGEKFEKVVGNNNFPEIEGKCTETGANSKF